MSCESSLEAGQRGKLTVTLLERLGTFVRGRSGFSLDRDRGTAFVMS